MYLGAKLHAKGHDVTLLGRRKLADVPDEIYINEQKYSLPKRQTELTKGASYDFVFITSKLYDLENILGLIKDSGVKTKILVSIQNGLVDNTKYKKLLGDQHLVVLSVFEGYRLTDNTLHMTPTELGWKVEDGKEGVLVSELLQDAGILCKPEAHLDMFRVEKTILNCCLNAMSAIEGKHFKDLFSVEKCRRRIGLLFDECYLVLSKIYDLEDKETLKNRMEKVWSKMEHYSSTYQDMVSGRPTEIDFLNGYIVLLGKKHGVPTPENALIISEFSQLS